MAAADDPSAPGPQGGGQAAARLFSEQSQLDFDIAFYDQVLARQPDYVDVLRCQAELLTRKGLHERAVVLDRRLAALLGDDCRVRYNLACSLAMVGARDEAIAALRSAFELGYCDFEHLEADPDLEGLRHSPAFRALVREYKKRG
ncbi:MAG: hypothetical protein WD278_01440 [Pirellulales bacterium]